METKEEENGDDSNCCWCKQLMLFILDKAQSQHFQENDDSAPPSAPLQATTPSMLLCTFLFLDPFLLSLGFLFFFPVLYFFPDVFMLLLSAPSDLFGVILLL